jgi:hypothetical protein
MHLKKWQNGRRARNGAYTWKGTTSRVMVVSRSKVSFWPDGSTSPGNYGWLFVHMQCRKDTDLFGCKLSVSKPLILGICFSNSKPAVTRIPKVLQDVPVSYKCSCDNCIILWLIPEEKMPSVHFISMLFSYFLAVLHLF